jgi:hypothetical protein
VPNALPNNRYNSLRLEGSDRVVKRGPAASMRGELFFYRCLSLLPPETASLFPAFFGHSEHFPSPFAAAAAAAAAATAVVPEALSPSPSAPAAAAAASYIELTLELVRGIPLYTLFQNQMLEGYVLAALLGALDRLHGTSSSTSSSPTPPPVPVTLTRDSLTRHYLSKMKVRFSDARLYCYDDCGVLTAELTRRLEAYVAGTSGGGGRGMREPVPVVHGDCWFSNVVVTGGDEVKLLDMRGLVDGALTLNGDRVYDYAKVLQSLLGFDEALYAAPRVPLPYRLSLLRVLVSFLEGKGVSPADAFDVCLCLMAGSLHAYEDEGTRARLWALVAGLLRPAAGSEEEAVVRALGVGVGK